MALYEVRGTAPSAPEQMGNTVLQNLVGLQPNGIAEFIVFQIVKKFRYGECRIGMQILAPQANPAIAFDDGIKHILPIICAVNVAGTESTAFQVTMLVEDKQRMITGLGEVTVISRAFLVATNRAFGTVDIKDQIGTFSSTPVHKSAKAAQILKEVGAWFLFLSKYSPDLNPIKMAFAKLKAPLRKAAARTFDEVWKSIGQICNMFHQKNAETTSKHMVMNLSKRATLYRDLCAGWLCSRYRPGKRPSEKRQNMDQ